ncbi:MAG: hypothetical protein NC905_01430 [Candidatus Omnitrophica bacterium]|nr:hypothetical protein [Candidatus Omnitrophota bacterium]MCM8776915.1 hypothetical protein [Candidatus Omnitrophota bacterium]
MKGCRKPLPIGVLLLGFIWVFLCLYVLLFCKIIAIGYKMEEAKRKYEEINMINKNYKAEILKLSSPEYLLRIVRNAGIELTNPSEWCYVDIINEDVKGNRNDTAEAGIQ